MSISSICVGYILCLIVCVHFTYPVQFEICWTLLKGKSSNGVYLGNEWLSDFKGNTVVNGEWKFFGNLPNLKTGTALLKSVTWVTLPFTIKVPCFHLVKRSKEDPWKSKKKPTRLYITA